MIRTDQKCPKIRFGLLPAMVLLSACATTSATAPAAAEAEAKVSAPAPTSVAATGQDPEIRAKLQAVLDAAAAYEQSPGMAMVVQIGNTEPYYIVTGFQDESKTLKMTPEMNFRIGSMTKNFVGTAILQQVDEGKISLDDTLQKWLPNVFTNIDGSKITIRMMLNHTSGIESYTNAYVWNRVVYSDPTHVWNAPTEFLKLTERLRAKSIACKEVIPPGSEFAYSNTNFILLGMIAAKVDGYPETDWQKVIEQRFITKLNLENTRIPGNGDNGLGSTNQGYVNFYNFYYNSATGQSSCSSIQPPCVNKDIDFTQQNMSNAWAAGAIMSTANNLLRWLNAEVKGNLLTPSMRKQQRTFIDTCNPDQPLNPAASPTASEAQPARRNSLISQLWEAAPGEKQVCTPLPTNCESTVQVGLAIFRQIKYGFIGHRGEVFGFDTTMQYLPEKDLTVVVLSNRTALDGKNVGPVPEYVAAALYPDLRPNPPPSASTSSP
ncbi:serine hydrolase domain-containing protein [Hyalangium versicolor]|uniref:serine hydrolase domain-containing protein n=1 Tax=Hyalangium versicolor TaxID=2861190 RepID=UPI001CCB13D9|nr:serine hydrolase domain-containing protein [Hyalangium versicolor]